MNIKIKLLELGKRQIDLCKALRENGYPRLQPCTLSKYLSGADTSPQSKAVLEVSERIISEWEAERIKKVI